MINPLSLPFQTPKFDTEKHGAIVLDSPEGESFVIEALRELHEKSDSLSIEKTGDEWRVYAFCEEHGEFENTGKLVDLLKSALKPYRSPRTATMRHIHMSIEGLLEMNDADLAETVSHPDGPKAARKELTELQQEGMLYLTAGECDNKRKDGSCAGHPIQK